VKKRRFSFTRVLTRQPEKKGEAPMKMEMTVAEVSELINEIRKQPESLFQMIRANVQETVGQYLSTLMDMELSEFLGRDRYERSEGEINHRNGSYGRKFTLKGIGKVDLRVLWDEDTIDRLPLYVVILGG